MKSYAAFGEMIKLIRTEGWVEPLTQLEFAEIVGVNRSQVSNVEIGNSDATLFWIECIAASCNIKISYDRKKGWSYK